jgi:hypothetical protein
MKKKLAACREPSAILCILFRRSNSDPHQWVPADSASVVDEDIDDKDVVEEGTFGRGRCSKLTLQ